MGTHISRVKSVDLDSWTDEQLNSVLTWGNSRANKYWEAKLAPGHVPSEAKIENFIRTKYDSKRWVMEGPIPDPSTLDADGDDDVPLNLVKERQSIDRSTSQRATSAQLSGPSAVRRAPQQDILGGGQQPVGRSASTASAPIRQPVKSEVVPPKQTKPADSLLGLDFFGDSTPPNRPSSAAPAVGNGAQSRPDLKQSILSLYASVPKPQPQQQPQHQSHGSFGGMQSPSAGQQSQISFGGMNDAFSGMSFSNPSSPPIQPQAAKPNAFAGLGNVSSSRSPQTQPQQPNYSGGGFFDTKPTPTAPPPPQPASRTFSSSSGFGAFGSAPGISPVATKPAASSGLGDFFDFGASSPAPTAPKQTMVSSPVAQQSSVFNLSTPQAAPVAQAAPPKQAASSGWSNTDAWGSNDAWGTPDAAPANFVQPIKAAPTQSNTGDFGWGSSSSLANQSIVPGGGGGFAPASSAKPTVAPDDDFGGWSSAAPVTPGAGTVTAPAGKPASGFAASEDLFSNVWE
jgi:stromal membrane-associated protein